MGEPIGPYIRHNDDNWPGRLEGMRCHRCMWFVIKAGEVGRCRRHAPTMVGFPIVYDRDWCGDFRLNENVQ
jgi:hypothetical protein